MIQPGNITLSDLPGGNVFAPGINGVTPLPGSVIIATAILRVEITGGAVVWSILSDSQHTPVFFTGCEQSPVSSARIRMTYPTVSKVLSFVVVVDETLCGQLTGVGATVDVDNADIQLGATVINQKLALQGNGAQWVLPVGGTNPFPDAVFTSTSVAIISGPSDTPTPFNNFALYSATYNGPNGRFVQKRTSGLGPFNLAFDLVDGTGGLQVPTTDDWMFIDTGNSGSIDINAYDPNNGWWNQVFANLWIFAAFQL